MISCATQTICTIVASIAVIAILATWGLGAVTALTARYARINRDETLDRFLRRRASLLTIVPMVITMVLVNAWFVIESFANPITTSTIAHTLMWFLALQGIAFIVQATAALMFVHGWERLQAKHHVTVSYVYAAASLIPVIVLAVIASFMTMPGTWVETFNIWDALMVPLAVPLFVISAAWGLVIGSALFMLITNATKELTPVEHDELEKRTIPALVMAAIAVPFLPLVVMVMAPLNIEIPSAMNWGLVLAAVALCFIIAAKLVRRESLGFAGSLVTALVAMAAAAAVTQSVSAINAPYTIRNYLFNNEVTVHDIPVLRRKGVLTDAVSIVPQGIDLTRTLSVQRGRWAFLASGYECNPSCTGERLVKLTNLLGKDAMRKVLREPGTLLLTIPPFMGTEDELNDLVAYLAATQEENQ